ncbi:MAG: cytochrome c biogenesis protein ResB [Bdellovibrio sp.]
MKILKSLASVKLAVFVILSLAILIAMGTLVESRLDARAAKVFVYDSWWMYATMGLLTVNLLAVIADRFPWKTQHMAFIFAHIGIIILLVGSVLTLRFGTDGILRLEPGQENNKVILPETELVLFRSPGIDDFQKIYTEEVEFLKSPVRAEKPFIIKAKDLDIKIMESVTYAVPKMQVIASQFSQSGAGLRLHLTNERVNFTDWFIQRNIFEKVEKDLGPVKITFGGLWERSLDRNEIRFVPQEEKVQYFIYGKNETRELRKGWIKEGEALKTPWMGLEAKALRYFPKAQTQWSIEKSEHPTPLTVTALRVVHNGHESWLFQNDNLKIFTDSHVYLLAFINKRKELPFSLVLKEFVKSDYPGTMRAMSYQSHVQTSEGGDHLIAMNEPLKQGGFYFYQASFDQNERGTVQASILSVNHDPGRILKYLGSFLLSLGIVMMFYFKKRQKNQAQA